MLDDPRFTTMLRLVQLVLGYMVAVHLATCSWHRLVVYQHNQRDRDETDEPSWVQMHPTFFEMHFAARYALCAQNAFQLLLGQSYSVTTLEHFAACLGMLVGALINASVFGTVAVLMQALDAEKNQFKQKMDSVNTMMRFCG